MSRSGEFCPRCGDPIEHPEPSEDDRRESSRPPESDAERSEASLCDACYLEAFDLVDAPERVEITVCANCGAVNRGNRWVDVGAEDYTDVAVDAVTEALGVHVEADSVSWQVAPEQVDETTVRMHCQFSGVIRGQAVVEEVTVPVRIGRGTCDRCGRIAGGSFASVVQVRAAERDPTDAELSRARDIAETYVAEREATGDRNAFITEVTEVDEGLNMKISTTQMGHGIAKWIVATLGGSYSDSEQLVGQDGDGNELYRVTYAVRLPRFRPGEIVDPGDDDGPVLVRSVQGTLKGVRLASGDRYEASFEAGDAPDATRLGEREDAVETTLVAVEDAHAVQVLDPETYRTESIARPDFLDTDADELLVFKSRAGLHAVPGETPDR